MRISMRNQYSSYLFNLQRTQSRLMELNIQSSSQKKINKPSDDGVGAGRVLNYRESIATIKEYTKNVDTGKGWLGLADESMLQVSTITTRLKALAEQGATGTMTSKDREANAYETRQLFGQLVHLSNTTFDGNQLFAGHKVEEPAFTEAMMAYDTKGKSLGLATGLAQRSIAVQFLGAEGSSRTVGVDPISYRYSVDGGVHWTEKTLGTAHPYTLDLGGCSLDLPENYSVDLSPRTNTKMSQGSWISVAPTAVYQGDHEKQAAVSYDQAHPSFQALPQGGFMKDVQIVLPSAVDFGVSPTEFEAQVIVDGVPSTVRVPNGSKTPVVDTPFGGVQLSGAADAGDSFTIHAGDIGVHALGADVNARGKGVFTGDVLVRIDQAATLGAGGVLKYSYSTDGGGNWSSGHSTANTAEAELLVPGGTLVLSPRAGSMALAEGNQFVIHPQAAAHKVEIGTDEYLQLNNIGSEVFGGFYAHGTEAVFADSDVRKNLFVSAGKLVAALENNDQQGCAEALENLKIAQSHFATCMASVGARENRLEVAGTVLSGLKLNQESRMSNLEDIDLSTLLTELANQQMSYEAVLKSSSMIMRMGLINYM